MLPIVAIVGRPNVGKSTLFNRLVGSRKAITYDQPGITRDRHYAPVSWDGHDFICTDTGGFFGESDLTVNDKVEEQIMMAIAEAAVVLLILDARQGLNPVDKLILSRIRGSGKPFVAVVNKVDQVTLQDEINEFYELGVENFYPISAEHGLRIGDLLDQVVQFLPARDKAPLGKSKEIKMAIIGRPNVGKSSLLNRLTGTTRAVVDSVAGTTRDVVDSLVVVAKKKYRLLDTMGIRKGGKSDTLLERNCILLAERAFLQADVALLVLDASEGVTAQDTHVAGLASQGGCGIIFLVNKWDLSKKIRGEMEDFETKIRETFKFLPYAPVLFVSAKSGLNIPKIWTMADRLHHEMSLQWSRTRLQEVLEEALEKHPPPVAGRYPLQFRKIVQTGQFPPTIQIGVDRPKFLHFSYERYLISYFRKALEIEMAPLKLKFSGSR